MTKEEKKTSSLLYYLNDNITVLNNSKFFAGLMIIILNISSKFVTINLSKTVEAYLKYTFSRDILIFAISWMGTRDIYIAIIITLLFIICVDFLFNEKSFFCVLPEQFTNYHLSLIEENNTVSDDEFRKAIDILEKYKKQQDKIIKTANYTYI